MDEANCQDNDLFHHAGSLQYNVDLTRSTVCEFEPETFDREVQDGSLDNLNILAGLSEQRSVTDYSPSLLAPVELTTSKTDTRQITSSSSKKKSTSIQRQVDFKPAKLNMIAHAWIAVSEDSVNGTSQQGNTFWTKVLNEYNLFKKAQEDHDTKQRINDALYSARLVNPQANREDISVTPAAYPERTLSSIKQKWQKYIRRYVHKFNSIFNQKYNPLPSGMNFEKAYEDTVSIFKAETGTIDKNGNVSKGVDFQPYRTCWEYLRDKPKFCASLNEIENRSRNKAAKKRSSPSSIEDSSSQNDDGTTISSKDVPDRCSPKSNKRHKGRDKSKASLRIAAIVDSVKDEISDFDNVEINDLKNDVREIAAVVKDGNKAFGEYLEMLKEKERLEIRKQELEIRKLEREEENSKK